MLTTRDPYFEISGVNILISLVQILVGTIGSPPHLHVLEGNVAAEERIGGVVSGDLVREEGDDVTLGGSGAGLRPQDVLVAPERILSCDDVGVSGVEGRYVGSGSNDLVGTTPASIDTAEIDRGATAEDLCVGVAYGDVAQEIVVRASLKTNGYVGDGSGVGKHAGKSAAGGLTVVGSGDD